MPSHSFAPIRSLVERPPVIDPFEGRVTRAGGSENARGSYVLYWAQMARRLRCNLALDYAIARANAWRLPLLVYESLRPDYPGANDRIHTFVLEGVASNLRDARDRGLEYVFFLPRTIDEARGRLRLLARHARLVVTDDYPTFIARRQTSAFVSKTEVAVDLVDDNGILPMRVFQKEQYSARFLRDRAHALFPDLWLGGRDFADTAPQAVHDVGSYDGVAPRDAAGSCAIDHSIAPVVATTGGRDAALARLDAFIRDGLTGYATGRNRSPKNTSGLSPYLHFGFISIREVAERVLRSDAPLEDVDAFLEEGVIRRELSFNLCHYRKDHDSLAALPDWAMRTLDRHRNDRRSPLYSPEELEHAATHDDVWNLAQRQLTGTGTMHGYLRMLWGKKIIEWSASPEIAHSVMIDLHERYALDGRDPNTHAGVLWCFGKHDRPWAPERPIFGTIRYMSSEQTRKKVRLGEVVAGRDR